MAEPLSTAIGFKLSTMLAGFAGGVVSLAFLRDLTRKQAFFAVVVGCLAANYLTPVASYWVNLPPNLENGAAFVLGLCGMNLIPALYKFVGARAAAAAAGAIAAEGDQNKKGNP